MSAFTFLACVAFLFISLCVADYPLNTTCSPPVSMGGTGTCCPSWCANATNPARTCDFSANWPSINYTQKVAATQCKTCTQSTDARCTTVALSALLGSFSSVKAAYCNDEYLIILSDGSPSRATNLEDIPNPPGSVDSQGACVTRVANPSYHQYKIPLYPSLLSTANRLNNLEAFAGHDNVTGGYLNSTTNGVYGLPTRGNVAVSVTGQDIFPVFNNRATMTPEACEVDSCNEHVGGGGGQPHLHGDPFGAWCLYSAANYSSLDAHPPQIGFSLDGYSVYGRYLSVNAPGYSQTLDDCGGHSHDSYGYHYHSQVINTSVDTGVAFRANSTQPVAPAGTPYATFVPGVYQCFRGNISLIPNFFGDDMSVEGQSYSQPCCGMTHYYVAPAIQVSGAGVQNTTDASTGGSGTGSGTGGSTSHPSEATYAHSLGVAHLLLLPLLLACFTWGS